MPTVVAGAGSSAVAEAPAVSYPKPTAVAKVERPPEHSLVHDGKALMISVRPSNIEILQSEGKMPIVLKNGRTEYIKDPDHPHRRIQFSQHFARVEMSDMPRMRTRNGYGSKFVEAIDYGDGDRLAQPLAGWINTARGTAFLSAVESRSYNANIRPTIKRHNMYERLEAEKATWEAQKQIDSAKTPEQAKALYDAYQKRREEVVA